MKKLLSIIAILALSGCGWANQIIAHVDSYTIVCVTETHIMYVQFPTGVAPLYNQDGTLVKCK